MSGEFTGPHLKGLTTRHLPEGYAAILDPQEKTRALQGESAQNLNQLLYAAQCLDDIYEIQRQLKAIHESWDGYYDQVVPIPNVVLEGYSYLPTNGRAKRAVIDEFVYSVLPEAIRERPRIQIDGGSGYVSERNGHIGVDSFDAAFPIYKPVTGRIMKVGLKGMFTPEVAESLDDELLYYEVWLDTPLAFEDGDGYYVGMLDTFYFASDDFDYELDKDVTPTQ